MSLLDPVREAFCQEYRKHGNQSEAFRTANPKSRNWKPETVHVKACNMMAEDKVKVRLQHLQEQSAAKYEIIIEKLTKMTLDAYEMAMTDEVQAPSAAVKASEFLGKLHGLVVEKRELAGKDGAQLFPAVTVSITRPGSVEPNSNK